MEILYVSRLCSAKRLAELLRDHPVKPPLQEQKFHGLLARGLATLVQRLTALCVLPYGPSTEGFPSTFTETEHGVTYHYLIQKKIPGLSHVIVFFWSFFSCLRWSYKHRAQVRFVVCDVLDLSITVGALLASKLTHSCSIAIVTDLPDDMGLASSAFSTKIIRSYRFLSNFYMERYDGYILLTEAMNSLVNPQGRPYLVMEGLVDSAMKEVPNTLEDKFPEQVVIYAGSLFAKYGVKNLLEAFLLVPHSNARLWLYGSGELDAIIPEYAANDSRIRFWGVCPNEEVVAAEIKATLLVNPRPSSETFTKYSFPSKIMEYMASGTPVVTTPLPGMPVEYLDYVYIFEDESVAGMAAMLTRLLDLPPRECHRRGQEAKAFVMTNKTNLIQADRVHAFLLSLG